MAWGVRVGRMPSLAELLARKTSQAPTPATDNHRGGSAAAATDATDDTARNGANSSGGTSGSTSGSTTSTGGTSAGGWQLSQGAKDKIMTECSTFTSDHDVLSLSAAFDEGACRTLIEHYRTADFDENEPDTVDGKPCHQCDLAKPALASIRDLLGSGGAATIERLWSTLQQLPMASDDPRVVGKPVPWDAPDCSVFIRRYSPDTRTNIKWVSK